MSSKLQCSVSQFVQRRSARLGHRVVASVEWSGWLPCNSNALTPKGGMQSGSCRMVHNSRLAAKAKAEFRLSVEAAGRRDVKKSARLNAGGGDVEAEEGAIDPEDDRRVVSGFHVSCCNNAATTSKSCEPNEWNSIVPSSGRLCAESLLPKVSSCGLTSLPSLTAAPASPRLVVKTLRQTLRGGISFLLLNDVPCSCWSGDVEFECD